MSLNSKQQIEAAENFGDGIWGMEFWKPLRKVRYFLAPYLAECLGTAIIVMFGGGVGISSSLYGAGDYLAICICWGIGVAIAIFVTAGASGAHLNPAVTLTMAVFDGFSWKQVIPYMAAQFLGGFLGACVTLLNYMPKISLSNGFVDTNKDACIAMGVGATSGAFITWPAEDVHGVGEAFYDEIIGTALLLIGIFAFGNPRSKASITPANLAWAVGWLVVVIGLAFGVRTGFAINPARDLGPRIALALICYGTDMFTAADYYFLVPLFSPFIGGLIGGCIYFGMIDHTRSEESHIIEIRVPTKSNSTTTSASNSSSSSDSNVNV